MNYELEIIYVIIYLVEKKNVINKIMYLEEFI